MELLSQGLTLMTYGIATVFIFLCILIGAIRVMSSVLAKLPDNEVTELASNNPPAPSLTHDVEPHIIEVIQAAISQHRNR